MRIVGPNMRYTYTQTADYSQLSVKYFDKYDEIIEYLADAEGKILFFVSSKEKGSKLETHYKKCNVKVAYVNAENKDAEGLDVVRKLANSRKFDEKVLIATSVLDVGVSIEDSSVQNVVVDTTERSALIQMLGRIRQTSCDVGFNLYIRNRKKGWFNLQVADLRARMELYRKAISYENAGRLSDFIIDCYKKLEVSNTAVEHCFIRKQHGWTVNNICRYYDLICLSNLEDMLEGLEHDPDYYIKKQLSWLGKEEAFDARNFISQEIYQQRLNEMKVVIYRASQHYSDSYTKEEIKRFLALCKDEFRKLAAKNVNKDDDLSWMKFNQLCEEIRIGLEIERNEKANPYTYKIKITDELDMKKSLEKVSSDKETTEVVVEKEEDISLEKEVIEKEEESSSQKASKPKSDSKNQKDNTKKTNNVQTESSINNKKKKE